MRQRDGADYGEGDVNAGRRVRKIQSGLRRRGDEGKGIMVMETSTV